MCGICGIINFNQRQVQGNTLQSMMYLMKHRGPDDQGMFLDGNIGLGFVRPSIIDLSPAGHQPMFSDDGRYVIVFSGEIYNYIELRMELAGRYHFRSKTDTDVLLNAYMEWGKECLHRFNGMFAFVIYDKKTKELFAARDRFGIKPFYYYINENQLVFASEQRAILPLLKDRTPNNKAIYEYMVYNRTDQGDYTFFKGIRKLPHGCCGTVEESIFKINRWYELKKELKEPFQTPAEFYETFKQAVKFRLRSDVPSGVCLSGGLDSSSIVSVLLKEFDKKDLKTFSAVYNKGEKADESEYIKLYKNQLKKMYFTHPTADTLLEDLSEFIECHSAPVAALGPYAQFKVMQLASEHIVVTLDGQGADEQLAGYHYFFGAYFKELLKKFKLFHLLSEISAYFKKYRSIYAVKYLGLYLLPLFLKDYFSKISHNFVTNDFYSTWKKNSDMKHSLYNPGNLNESLIQHFEYKLEHLLKWEDHNSMWYSLESRVPFLDHNLVERTLCLPSEKIINKATTKFILREAMREVLPEKIRNRQDKIGFETPWEKWFRTEKFKSLIFEMLNSTRFKERGYLDPGKCVEAYRNHLAGNVNAAKEILKWINLELWFQKFID